MLEEGSKLRLAVRTKARQEVIHYAGEALRKFPGLEAVRFVIPTPRSVRPWDIPDSATAVSPAVTDICTVYRERGFVWATPNHRIRLFARFHDGRSDDTFFGDENGGLWEVDNG
jgi:hypothetical protein